MTNAEEKAQAFGITLPLGVPGHATVIPPDGIVPNQEIALRNGAGIVANHNVTRLKEYKNLIDSYKAYRIDPPYPPPPSPLDSYSYLAADNSGKVFDRNSWMLGIPAEYAFPPQTSPLYFWAWSTY